LKSNTNIISTTYRFSNIENWEEFIHNLFTGLKHYEKKHKDFKFKLTYSKDSITLNVIKLNESVN
jgi:hypothetical protein